MQDTGQHLDAGQLLQGLRQRDSQLYQLHAQLRHFQAWTGSLATTAMQPLSMHCMLAAIQVMVSGFPESTTERELALFFNNLIAAHGAAVAPGPAVSDCKLLRGSQGVAVLELRCAVEATNCMAFDGVQFRDTYLKIQRPRDYRVDAAILLGPCQPDPAVIAAFAHSQQQQHRNVAVPFIDQGQYSNIMAASGPASWQHVLAGDTHSGSHTSSMMRVHDSVPPAAGSAGSNTAAQDLAPAADQSKQDEVFIGGLPSHWKAQQVKNLLAPYGRLKSLSVAMDAATGKNKGYAFVVFADPLVVPDAIEQLDCKVVEGKILAVQRATEGKAAGAASFGKEISSLMMGPMNNSHRMPGGQPSKQHQQHSLQQQHLHHQRVSSGSSSGSSSAGGFLPMAAADNGPNAAYAHTGVAISNGASMLQSQQRQHAAPTAYPHQQQHNTVRPATAGAANNGAALGQRLLAAVTAGAAGSANASKQYDVNELYIGDLPLSWDEDAVRRLLGRYGKIKYFTLRSGRDKNFAFCKFKDSSVVDAAIKGLHGKIVDGYFLNVRRAIEGKQQQQPHFQGRYGPPDAGRGPAQSKVGQIQQQQQSKIPQSSSLNMGAKIAGMDNSRPSEQQKDACGVPEAAEASGMEAAAAAVDVGVAAAVVEGQQQRTGSSTASTAPSPPTTPTAAALREQSADEAAQQLLEQKEQLQPQLENPLPAAQQSQQLQQQLQPSLFLNSSGPASWGAPGLFTAAYNQQQPQQQSQQQQHESSLLQTWDMLSPWSLFSGSTQKVQW